MSKIPSFQEPTFRPEIFIEVWHLVLLVMVFLLVPKVFDFIYVISLFYLYLVCTLNLFCD